MKLRACQVALPHSCPTSQPARAGPAPSTLFSRFPVEPRACFLLVFSSLIMDETECVSMSHSLPVLCQVLSRAPRWLGQGQAEGPLREGSPGQGVAGPVTRQASRAARGTLARSPRAVLCPLPRFRMSWAALVDMRGESPSTAGAPAAPEAWHSWPSGRAVVVGRGATLILTVSAPLLAECSAGATGQEPTRSSIHDPSLPTSGSPENTLPVSPGGRFSPPRPVGMTE